MELIKLKVCCILVNFRQYRDNITFKDFTEKLILYLIYSLIKFYHIIFINFFHFVLVFYLF